MKRLLLLLLPLALAAQTYYPPNSGGSGGGGTGNFTTITTTGNGTIGNILTVSSSAFFGVTGTPGCFHYIDSTTNDTVLCAPTTGYNGTWYWPTTSGSSGQFLSLGSAGQMAWGAAVTSVATTSPIGGGTITGTGTLTCATCIVASAPSAGFSHMAGSTQTMTTQTLPRGFGATFDGGGSALTSGKTYYGTIPYACTISAWNITVDTGTATFDIWVIASGTAIPTVSNSITASAQPAIASNTALHSTTMTGWPTTVAANSIVGINLKTVASTTNATFNVQCDETN